ncbi:right-handed parallel beta-helix repeat-containing protein [Kitasatospora sp. NPDC054939]
MPAEFFVDPHGDDNAPGTREQPFATLERAREAARAGDVVNLRAGFHRLARPLELTAEHSGVTYQAYGWATGEPEEAVVSGGRVVDGWVRGEDGVRRAPSGPAPVRQLSVDGRRVPRAEAPLDGAAAPRVTGVSEVGHLLEGPELTGDAVEFVYRGAYPWSEARLPVARLHKAQPARAGRWEAVMAQPAFARAHALYRAVGAWEGDGVVRESNGAERPAFAVNSPALLTPGTFAHSDGVLHHLPLPSEEFGPGSGEAVVPVLEVLLHAAGVRDVSFRGITFADSTWLRPASDRGYVHYHGNGHYDGGELMVVELGAEEADGRVTVPVESASMPGTVVFENASGVLVEGCRFTRLGAVALEFRGEGADNTVRGNLVEEVCGGGIVIGDGAARHRVERNRVRRVGLEHSGSPAVLVSGAADTVLAHNEVAETPHAGIVVYGGHGTRVLNNLVHDTMQVLADGGGIYLSGPQGTSPEDGALVRGNVVRDTVTPYNFGLYLDYGAAWVTVEGNAVLRADTPIALHVAPPLEEVVFRGNLWDADPGDAPAGVRLEGNTVLPAESFEADPAVAAVVAAAGPDAVRD